MSWSLIILLVLLLAALAWFMRRPEGQAFDDLPAEHDDSVEYEVLRDAEAEVQDLDALASPDEAEEELRDWGPGAPNM